MMTVEIYKDKSDKHWRWRIRTKKNGRIVATSGEGYTRERDVKRALLGFFTTMINESAKVGSDILKANAKKTPAIQRQLAAFSKNRDKIAAELLTVILPAVKAMWFK